VHGAGAAADGLKQRLRLRPEGGDRLVDGGAALLLVADGGAFFLGATGSGWFLASTTRPSLACT
jgi:hypothetical protein